MDIYELAGIMHKHLCKWNHTDGCSWYYEEAKGYPHPTWEAFAHKEWLEKAFRVEAETDMPLTNIAEVIRAL